MKVLAVTGGAQGIGRGIALYFAANDYAISFTDVDEEAASKTAGELQALGAKVMFVPADVSRAQDVTLWAETTVRELGCPNVLVNNAGIARNGDFLELTVEDFDRVIAVNLRGTFLCSQASARRMVEHGVHGTIINIASTRAFMSEPNTEAYTASKGGIVSLTHAMAISLGEHRIRVNCISPGWIETPRVPAKTERDHLQHPVGRVGKPEDIAEACLFLAEHAGFITGQNLTIDGGMTKKMIYEE
ncbi:MAG: SDR family NAD(P)-dependent oxidoreductase [Vulcanimicrobiaceae bacterium]